MVRSPGSAGARSRIAQRRIAVTRAEMGDRLHGRQPRPEVPEPELPEPVPPLGHTPVPSPARTCVIVFIVVSRSAAAGIAGAGTAVGAEPRAFACVDPRGRLHRRISVHPWPELLPLPPTGQIPGPSPARTCVVVFIAASPVQPWPELPPEPELPDPPRGQRDGPSPARTRVVVFIVRSLGLRSAGAVVAAEAVVAFTRADVGGRVHRRAPLPGDRTQG